MAKQTYKKHLNKNNKPNNFKGNNFLIKSTSSISIDNNVKANYSIIESNSIINKNGGLRYNRTSIFGNIESKNNRYIIQSKFEKIYKINNNMIALYDKSINLYQI